MILTVVRLILGCNTEEAYVYAYSLDFQVHFDTDEIETIFDHFRGKGGIPKFLRIPVLFAAPRILPLLRDHRLRIAALT